MYSSLSWKNIDLNINDQRPLVQLFAVKLKGVVFIRGKHFQKIIQKIDIFIYEAKQSQICKGIIRLAQDFLKQLLMNTKKLFS